MRNLLLQLRQAPLTHPQHQLHLLPMNQVLRRGEGEDVNIDARDANDIGDPMIIRGEKKIVKQGDGGKEEDIKAVQIAIQTPHLSLDRDHDLVVNVKVKVADVIDFKSTISTC